MTDTTASAPKPDRRKGVWVSYYEAPLSDPTPHASEIAALRDAVGTSKVVKFVPFGTTVESAS